MEAKEFWHGVRPCGLWLHFSLHGLPTTPPSLSWPFEPFSVWLKALLCPPWAHSHQGNVSLFLIEQASYINTLIKENMMILIGLDIYQAGLNCFFRWFPGNERASAVGISMAGFHLGNVIGLVLTPIMLSSIGISGPFILFSSLDA